MYSKDFLTTAAQGDIKLTQEDQSLEKRFPNNSTTTQTGGAHRRLAWGLWTSIYSTHMFKSYRHLSRKGSISKTLKVACFRQKVRPTVCSLTLSAETTLLPLLSK